jgi:steroid delta-isomerase-like uncharacterized protein
MSPAESRKQQVRGLLDEVWTAGLVDAADRYLGARYTIHHDPGDPWHGQTLDRAAYKQRARLSRAPFPDQRFAVRELIAEGDAVVVTWTWNGTHAGDLPGFPASGKEIRTSGMTVYYFEGDRITGHFQIVDRASVFQQLRGAIR